jgi:DNA-binding NarL/FixJ family response regulator
MTKPRVLLADDHRILAEGLKSMLANEYEVVGIVENGRDLVERAKHLRPDVIVADISMPLLNGIDAVTQLKEAKLRSKVIFLTMHPDVHYVARALEAGASGYVLKHSAKTELVTAIREALAGGTYVTPEVADELNQFDNKRDQPPDEILSGLTARQREVLQLFAEGRIAKEVAAVLNISRRTAEFHKARIMKELNIHSTAELTQFAIKHGIISVD